MYIGLYNRGSHGVAIDEAREADSWPAICRDDTSRSVKMARKARRAKPDESFR